MSKPNSKTTESQRLKFRRYNQRNKEQVLATTLGWRKKNRKKYNDYQREYMRERKRLKEVPAIEQIDHDKIRINKPIKEEDGRYINTGVYKLIPFATE